MTKTLSQLLSLENKKVLIIGGGGWLGRSIVEVAVENGANVTVAGKSKLSEFPLSKEWLSILVNEKKVTYHSVDVLNPSEIANLRLSLILENGLDVLVNCFWSGRKSGWDDADLQSWKYDIDVNLNGTFIVCKEFSDEIVKARGTILNVSSMYSTVAPRASMYDDVPQSNPPGYGAAKAGINQLSRYLASFLGKSGVTVNTISPGPFPFPDIQEKFPLFGERLMNQTMVGRIGDPDDLKGVVAVLISDAGKYITGQNIAIDGGWTGW